MPKRSYSNSFGRKAWNAAQLGASLYARNRMGYKSGGSYTKRRKLFRKSRGSHRQFGGKFLRTYRKRGSKKQKATRRLTKLTGYGSKQFLTAMFHDVTKVSVPLDKTQFHLLPTANGSNGIGTFEQRNVAIPQIRTHFSSSVDKDAAVIVKNISSTIQFKNQSNVQSVVELLVVKCIRDIPDEEVTLQTMLGKGFLDTTLNDSGDHRPGITLYNCPRFWRYFKVQSKKKFFLDPGAQREKTIISNYAQRWNTRYTNTASYIELKGALRFMLIVRGSLGHGVLASTQITYSPISLDVLFTSRVQGTVGSLAEPECNYTTTGVTVPATIEAFVNANADEEVIETS